MHCARVPVVVDTRCESGCGWNIAPKKVLWYPSPLSTIDPSYSRRYRFQDTPWVHFRKASNLNMYWKIWRSLKFIQRALISKIVKNNGNLSGQNLILFDLIFNQIPSILHDTSCINNHAANNQTQIAHRTTSTPDYLKAWINMKKKGHHWGTTSGKCTGSL